MITPELGPAASSRKAIAAAVGSFESLAHRGTYTVHAPSDQYLFPIAADYHFHFVKHWLATRGIREFTGSWSQHLGPLDASVTDLF